MMILKNRARLDALESTHVCPLCPLHCDDVRIESDARLIVDGCHVVDDFPSLRDHPVDRGEIDMTTSPANRPLRVVTTGVDLASARQLSNWQSAGRISLTIESDPSIQAVMDVTSRDGIVTATLADVALHADVIWMIGGVEKSWPRIAEKLRLTPHNDAPTVVERFPQCSAEQLTELASAIEHPRVSGADDGNSIHALAVHADRWKDARYAAILIGPGAFTSGEESIAATMLARLVRRANAKTRSVLVILDAGATLRSVCLWKTNTAPTSMSTSMSTSISTSTDAAQPVFDIRIGSPLGSDSPSTRLQISGIDPGASLATAFRSCSVAGLHRPGMTIRGDGSVSLPLERLVDSEFASASEVIASMLR